MGKGEGNGGKYATQQCTDTSILLVCQSLYVKVDLLLLVLLSMNWIELFFSFGALIAPLCERTT